MGSRFGIVCLTISWCAHCIYGMAVFLVRCITCTTRLHRHSLVASLFVVCFFFPHFFHFFLNSIHKWFPFWWGAGIFTQRRALVSQRSSFSVNTTPLVSARGAFLTCKAFCHVRLLPSATQGAHTRTRTRTHTHAHAHAHIHTHTPSNTQSRFYYHWRVNVVCEQEQ